ncbi:MAG: PDZ domain-containing protein [Oscillospiraceae bacterium]|nr:PDZ domain-containing protein [Oscillospiraceae bacterium]
MRKKITLSTAISYMFIAMTVTFCLTMILSTRMFEAKVSSVNEKESMYDKVSDIDRVVRQNYYTTVDDTNIYESLSAGYVNGLKDSESRYLTTTEVTEYQEEMSGKIIGIGMDIAKSKEDGGYMRVYKVYSESPADVQGIAVNDLLTAINGISTINLTEREATKLLSGKSGTTVDVTYRHEDSETTATLTRKAYDAPSVSYSKEDTVGYIKITNFSSRTASELEYAANNLTSQGATSLCIDIRNNASKDFDSAADAADILLKEGTTMYAVYQDGERKVLYTSDKTATTLPVTLITNGGTGYAAEMFTVMLKDTAGAKTVGTTTMGKGTLQKLFRLPDGSGVVLTVATLSPTASAVYTGTGIAPDYEKALDSTQEASAYTFTISNDPQILRAFEVARNLTVQQ